MSLKVFGSPTPVTQVAQEIAEVAKDDVAKHGIEASAGQLEGTEEDKDGKEGDKG